MDRTRPFAQSASIALVEHGLNFRDNRERDFLGSASAEIQTDRRVQTRKHLRVKVRSALL
jgi:hypothetical protein